MKCKGYECFCNPNQSNVQPFYTGRKETESVWGRCPFDVDGECTSEKMLKYVEEREKQIEDQKAKVKDRWDLANKQATKIDCKFTLAVAMWLKRNFPDWEYDRIKSPHGGYDVFIYSKRFKEFI